MNNIQQVRPWVRYWARSMDVGLFAILFGFVSGFLYPITIKIPDIIINVIIFFVWLFVETVLLCACGTTLGKWLLGINIKNSAGKKLSFTDALKRSFSVWLKGLGMSLPFISIFTLISSYRQLINEKITEWDKKGGIIVSHRRISITKITLAILLYVGFIAFIVLGTN